MFWIGFLVGAICVICLRPILTTISAVSKDSKCFDLEECVFEGFEAEIEKEWLERGVTKNGRQS